MWVLTAFMENRAAGNLCRLSGYPLPKPVLTDVWLRSSWVSTDTHSSFKKFINLKEFNLITNGIVLRCISSLMRVLWAGDIENRSFLSSSQQHCILVSIHFSFMKWFSPSWNLFVSENCGELEEKLSCVSALAVRAATDLLSRYSDTNRVSCSCVTTTQGASSISFCSVNFQNSRNN